MLTIRALPRALRSQASTRLTVLRAIEWRYGTGRVHTGLMARVRARSQIPVNGDFGPFGSWRSGDEH